MPGTANWKYEPPRPVSIETFTETRYSLEELEAVLPPPPNAASDRFRMPAEPLVDGEGRNTLLYKLARSLRARNLDAESIRLAVESENTKRCDPPLPFDELKRLLDGALMQPDRPEFRGASAMGTSVSEGSAWPTPGTVATTGARPAP